VLLVLWLYLLTGCVPPAMVGSHRALLVFVQCLFR
jgi:hypothetical protein